MPPKCEGCGSSASEVQAEIQRYRNNMEQLAALKGSLEEWKWHQRAMADFQRKTDEMYEAANMLAHNNYLMRQALWARRVLVESPTYLAQVPPPIPFPRRRESREE
ncbi:hypothetical protein GCK32_019448 [Trichostrongylus colubriformis]|uniref:Uncharacterized protein n=1 Tax=Trichostrongylus colubriformis TaxID=6319 RepID=A0AAN8F3M4_TRICO